MMKIEMKMNSTTLTSAGHPAPPIKMSLRKRILTPLICSVFAAVGIFGGISSLFAGLICVVVHSVISGDTVFDQAGTLLLIVAIPMILVGSVFLDEIGGQK